MIRRPRPDGGSWVNRCRIRTCSRQTQTDGGTTSHAQRRWWERFGSGNEKSSGIEDPLPWNRSGKPRKKSIFQYPLTTDRDGHCRNRTQTNDNDDDTVIFTCWRFSACAVSVLCACVSYIVLKMIITERM